MSQSIPITVVGNVVNDPHRKEVGGSQVVQFRLAANEARLDPTTGEWSERTSFFTVSAWRHLGANVGESLRKGDRVVVQGTLRVREYRTEQDEPRVSVDISATTVGVDLTYGVARFVKVRRNADGTRELPQASAPAEDPMVPAPEAVPEPV